MNSLQGMSSRALQRQGSTLSAGWPNQTCAPLDEDLARLTKVGLEEATFSLTGLPTLGGFCHLGLALALCHLQALQKLLWSQVSAKASESNHSKTAVTGPKQLALQSCRLAPKTELCEADLDQQKCHPSASFLACMRSATIDQGSLGYINRTFRPGA